MNWQLLIPLLVTTFVAISGWYVIHRFQAGRDLAGKRRDARVSYLIEAYRRIAEATERDMIGPDRAKGLEAAFADIQLFGSREQVRLARLFAETFNKGEDKSLEKLLDDLRTSLRRELQLEPIADPPFAFRLHLKGKPRRS